MTDETLAWHFTAPLSLRDGRPIPAVGEWLLHIGKIKICESGLHASEQLIDALAYAPGSMLHRVTCRGIADRHRDKFVCRERRIEWSIDATDLIRAFARKAALSVAHLWDMPDGVRQYLETGDESLRSAAWAAAWAAKAAKAAWSVYGSKKREELNSIFAAMVMEAHEAVR